MALHHRQLVNDTAINVAQVLKEPVGATRQVSVQLDTLPLDEQIQARGIEADVRLTRMATGLLATGTIEGRASIECVRCLESYEAAFSGDFDAEFRPVIDVRTGDPLPLPSDDEVFLIGSNHELDLTELLRQMALLSLPMQPICGAACPGIERDGEAEAEQIDERFAALGRLLESDGPERDEP